MVSPPISQMGPRHCGGLTMATLARPLIPEFFDEDIRDDWGHFALVNGPADLAGIGDTAGAEDLFSTLYFGA